MSTIEHTPSRRALPTLVRRLLAALAIVTVGATGVASPAGAAVVAPDAQTAVREIVFPVAGPMHFSDTFGACRSGCSRGHEGTDIMADKLTPMVAARDATVSWLKDTATPDGSHGNYIMLRDSDGWEYRYIHVNNDSPGTDDGANPKEWIFAPGIERGSEVTAGQLIGWLGDSGNAEHTAPHLHFEIHNPDGEVINPYTSLVAAPRLTAPIDAPTTGYAGQPSREAFVEALYADFLGRPPTDVQLVSRVARLSTTSRAALVDEFATSPEWVRNLLDGYYQSTLGRDGDPGGIAHWTREIDAGTTPARVAAHFYASDEYHVGVGGDDRAWVSDLYAELLHRTPDEGGLQAWIDQLAAGTPRSAVSFAFYQSPESREARVTGLYDSLLGRAPDPNGRRHWAGILADGHDLRLATNLASSDEYLSRAVSRFG